jgi:hypothetical protein
MKTLLLVVALAACGSKSSTPIANAGSGDSEPAGPVTDTRTELEKRRDAACQSLGPRITTCAVEDAKQQLAAGTVKQKDFDASTAPDVQRKNTEEFVKACEKAQYSSRQVRVLEVCQREESQCEPLLACLDNLNKE